MRFRTLSIPIATALVGCLLVLVALQLMTTDLLMTPAAALLGIGGLAAIYGVIWLAETIGDHVRGEHRPQPRRR